MEKSKEAQDLLIETVHEMYAELLRLRRENEDLKRRLLKNERTEGE